MCAVCGASPSRSSLDGLSPAHRTDSTDCERKTNFPFGSGICVDVTSGYRIKRLPSSAATQDGVEDWQGPPPRGADAQELHRCHPRTGMDHQNSPRTTNELHGKRNVDERSRSLSRTCWTLEWRSSRRGLGRILLVVQSAPPVLLPGGG
jgi:hypothetical protein